MSTFLPKKIIPVLVSADVEQSIQFYQPLGFKLLFGDTHYAAMGFGAVEFHISPMHHLQTEKQKLVAGWTSFRIEVNLLEALYDSYAQQNLIDPKEVTLNKRDYGMLEFTLLDPSGVAVTFFEDV